MKLKKLPRETVEYQGYTFDIEVVNITAFKDGVNVFARAWTVDDYTLTGEDGKERTIPAGTQIGFGEDGTVDIERFRIMRPALIIAIETDEKTTNSDGDEITVFQEVVDAKKALHIQLMQSIKCKRQMFDDSKIQANKIGNTTTTVRPLGGSGTAPIDGFTRSLTANADFATTRADSGQAAFASETSAVTARLFGGTTTDTFSRNDRAMFGFSTTAIGSDSVSSAVLSVYVVSKASAMGNVDIDIVSHTPVSESALSTADHAIAKFGSTVYASLNTSAITAAAFNDWTFNASGRSYIEGNGSGNSIFGMIHEWDTDNSFGGTWASAASSGLTECRMADFAGTTSDPYLTIEHAAGGGGGGSAFSQAVVIM